MRLTLTKQAEYALRMLIWLASQDASSHAPIESAQSTEQRSGADVTRYKAAEIARASDVPGAYATRVLALLHRRGLLLARAGQRGGYALARSRITLLEVIEAVEGPLTTPECVLRDTPCGFPEGEPYCVLHEAWRASREALRDVLAVTPLARDASDVTATSGT